jgi:hypothetical protein
LLKLVLPLKLTFIVWFPDERLSIERVAFPALSIATIVGGILSILKIIEPIGINPEGDVTVAVKETESPKEEGFFEETNSIFVLTWLTTRVPLAVPA